MQSSTQKFKYSRCGKEFTKLVESIGKNPSKQTWKTCKIVWDTQEFTIF